MLKSFRLSSFKLIWVGAVVTRSIMLSTSKLISGSYQRTRKFSSITSSLSLLQLGINKSFNRTETEGKSTDNFRQFINFLKLIKL